MVFRTVDSDGDWRFGAGLSSFSRDLYALIQNLQTRLKSWKGDCFFATDEGVDYANLLDRGTKSLLDLDVKRVILQSEGVMRIQPGTFESEIDPMDRNYSASADILTFYGTITIEV